MMEGAASTIPAVLQVPAVPALVPISTTSTIAATPLEATAVSPALATLVLAPSVLPHRYQ